MSLHIVLIALAAGFVASVVRGGVTPGWENICRDRKEFPSAKVLWRADLKDVSYELRDGAEGSVTVGDGIIRIVKTNSKCTKTTFMFYDFTGTTTIRTGLHISYHTE